ncbi:Hypothetical predicted protein [Podarcis lilfordi]|uniref:Uncharacterized protein n=1 Tax=Podarcis lilfordi TaxID=74358 RepID=A0AA35KV41_9SAUR|nr:Hypothetical predicted protein [Podarcis lilfordi]
MSSWRGQEGSSARKSGERLSAVKVNGNNFSNVPGTITCRKSAGRGLHYQLHCEESRLVGHSPSVLQRIQPWLQYPSGAN